MRPWGFRCSQRRRRLWAPPNTPRAERRRSVGCGRCGVGGGGVGGGDEDAGSGTVSKKRPWGRHGQPRVSPRP
ncbi:unnamed protein product [Lampetra fluviatilis]